MRSVEFEGLRNRKEAPKAPIFARTAATAYVHTHQTARRRYVTYIDVIPVGTAEESSLLLSHPLNERLDRGFTDIAKLTDDWNSYGAPAPTTATIELAKQTAKRFPVSVQPEISPESDGSIGLYWDYDKTYCIRIKAGKKPCHRWFIESADGSRTEPDSPGNLDEIIISFLEALKRRD